MPVPDREDRKIAAERVRCACRLFALAGEMLVDAAQLDTYGGGNAGWNAATELAEALRMNDTERRVFAAASSAALDRVSELAR